MIQATELRIGNYVRVNSAIPGPIAVVTAVSENHITTDTMGRVVLGRYIIPIPLTPEILEKAGFRINNDSGNWNSPGHTIYSNKAGSSIGILGDFIGWRFETEDDFYSWYHELKYLHQLQNLYFALTGTELEIDFK